MSFFDRFRRTTSSSAYIPQLDGLRFLAIFLVVVQMHITHYIDEKVFGSDWINKNFLTSFVMEGLFGVYLFFMISGFILALPFARSYLLGEKKVSLKNYYLRRLTRLEPPYIIALTLFFVVLVVLLKKYSFTDLLPHYLASLFYCHNLIYHKFSLVLPVAWTLEIEVQFYVLAPLLFLVYRIPAAWIRYLIFVAVIIGVLIMDLTFWKGIGNIFSCICFFAGGMLLADLYTRKKLLFTNPVVAGVVGMVSLAVFVLINPSTILPLMLVKYLAMFLLMHTVLSNEIMKRLFSWAPLAIIGGMCYSIYLLHFAILSFTGSLLLRTGWPLQNKAFIPIYYLLFITVILIISGLYFLFIEKPFMNVKFKIQNSKVKKSQRS
jgi:peptidoglycan/LPS O-acetylase OafA/YrhL